MPCYATKLYDITWHASETGRRLLTEEHIARDTTTTTITTTTTTTTTIILDNSLTGLSPKERIKHNNDTCISTHNHDQ